MKSLLRLRGPEEGSSTLSGDRASRRLVSTISPLSSLTPPPEDARLRGMLTSVPVMVKEGKEEERVRLREEEGRCPGKDPGVVL